MQTIRYLLSFRGRIGRADFWILMLIAVATVAAAFVIANILKNGELTSVFGIAASIAGIAVGLSAMTRRLHDREKSAWFLLLISGVPTVLQNLAHPERGILFYPVAFGFNSFIDLICLGVAAWAVVEMGFLPGSSGENIYGAAPLLNDSAAG